MKNCSQSSASVAGLNSFVVHHFILVYYLDLSDLIKLFEVLVTHFLIHTFILKIIFFAFNLVSLCMGPRSLVMLYLIWKSFISAPEYVCLTCTFVLTRYNLSQDLKYLTLFSVRLAPRAEFLLLPPLKRFEQTIWGI